MVMESMPEPRELRMPEAHRAPADARGGSSATWNRSRRPALETSVPGTKFETQPDQGRSKQQRVRTDPHGNHKSASDRSDNNENPEHNRQNTAESEKPFA